jgi:N-acetylmuramoyl-L-alanine amidase
MSHIRTNAIVYLLCGLPGTGKTTYAKNLQNETHFLRISFDEEFFTTFTHDVPQNRFAEYEAIVEDRLVEVIKNPPEAVVIRDKPDKKALVIAKADAGKDYSFTAKVGEWYQIVLPEGKIGWIHNESVNKLGTKEMAASVGKAKVLGVASDRQQLLVIKQTPTDWLNVRKNPSAVAQIITKVYPGERYPFSELQSGWYKIVLKDMTEGWVSSEYVKPENEMLEQSNIFVEVTPPQGGVNIREKPDLESAIIKRIYIHNRYPKLGETNGWVKIEMLDDKIGYVSKEFTKDIQ